MSKSSGRRRVTLIEVLVVLAIIAVLIGFLLPSVEKVRGAAARMQCTTNMKQIALAAHSYAEANGNLPGGSIVGSAKEPADRLGVFVSLLPYVEQDVLYKQFDQKRAWADQKAAGNGPKIYRCPINNGPASANHSNYVAVAGVDPDAATLPRDHARAGAFGYDRVVRMKDIKDGTSNTLFFLESHQETGPWASAGRATLRGIDPDDETPVGEGRAFGGDHAVGEWSWRARAGGCNAALADGSVRTLKAGLSAEMLSALATIAGGEDMAAREW